MEEPIFCRKCGKQIIFIRTKTGSNMPVNATPVEYWADPNGESVVYQRDGTRTRCRLDGNLTFMTGYGYLPHWGQCKGADELRRPRKREETPAEKKFREQIAKEKAEREERARKAAAKAEMEAKVRAAEAAQISLFEY
ncbi:MAG: hypothetical protein EOM54_11645 [Clostridia bacterium]|nr:hypothetical protein [Clostridia bacterium]